MAVNVLNIAEFNILKFEELEHDYNIRVEMASPPSCCHHCGCVANLYGHGSKEQVFRDIPAHKKRQTIYIARKRFKCRECNRTFLEPLPMIDDKRLMTRRLLKYIEKESLISTFKRISIDIGLDEKTVRNVFHDHVKWLEKHITFPTPTWLGIDEAHLLRSYRCVLTNVKNRTVYDILKNRNKATVLGYLKQMPNKENVEVVCMDMWNPYKEAAQKVFPWAKIIIDKFHVVKGANEALEQIRKKIRKSLSEAQRKTLMHDRFTLLRRKKSLKPFEILKLESWIANYSELGIAYNLKESFFDIFDTSEDRQEAMERYKEWRGQVPQSHKEHFAPLLISMKNWETEIFNYFDTPIGSRPTNAYTETFNGQIKDANRDGHGYSFDVLRAKMLYAKVYEEMSRPVYAKDVDFCGWNGDDFPDPDENINTCYKDNYVTCNGPGISTLCQYLGDKAKDSDSTR